MPYVVIGSYQFRWRGKGCSAEETYGRDRDHRKSQQAEIRNGKGSSPGVNLCFFNHFREILTSLQTNPRGRRGKRRPLQCWTGCTREEQAKYMVYCSLAICRVSRSSKPLLPSNLMSCRCYLCVLELVWCQTSNQPVQISPSPFFLCPNGTLEIWGPLLWTESDYIPTIWNINIAWVSSDTLFESRRIYVFC